MKVVSLSEFHPKCSALLRLVKETQEHIRITRYGKPLAEIGPPGLSPKERAAQDAREVEILNRCADELNAEAGELWHYHVPDGYVLKKISTAKKKSRKRRK
jgi:antitoxin (DNA-binding transcriptional repressor) of toxin-antitoxin stability system